MNKPLALPSAIPGSLPSMDCSNCIAINEPILYNSRKYKNICDECIKDLRINKFTIVYPNVNIKDKRIND